MDKHTDKKEGEGADKLGSQEEGQDVVKPKKIIFLAQNLSGEDGKRLSKHMIKSLWREERDTLG